MERPGRGEGKGGETKKVVVAMVMPSDLCEVGVTLEFFGLKVQSLLHFFSRHLFRGSRQSQVRHCHHCGIILCVCVCDEWYVYGACVMSDVCMVHGAWCVMSDMCMVCEGGGGKPCIIMGGSRLFSTV